MSDKQRQIIERMRKVLALAKGGTGGERDNAERQLEAMLKKHGLTMADIDDETCAHVKAEFHYRNEFELKLAVQTVTFVLDTFDIDVMEFPGSRTRFHVYMTPAQKAQCEYVYELLKPAMRDVLLLAYSGFLMAQNLYPSTTRNDKKLTPDELRRSKQAAAMSSFMDRKSIHKAIGN